jgi:hypothetical protein
MLTPSRMRSTARSSSCERKRCPHSGGRRSSTWALDTSNPVCPFRRIYMTTSSNMIRARVHSKLQLKAIRSSAYNTMTPPHLVNILRKNTDTKTSSLVLVLRRRRPARLEHALHAVSCTHHPHRRSTYLHHLELHAASRLAVGDREERRERRVAHDRRERVAVLVREPVPASAR